jgi:hypothetical protein
MDSADSLKPLRSLADQSLAWFDTKVRQSLYRRLMPMFYRLLTAGTRPSREGRTPRAETASYRTSYCLEFRSDSAP